MIYKWYFDKLDFHKIEEKYCYQKNYHKEQEFSIAEEECAFDPECLGFYHRECEGNKFRLCKKSLTIKDSKKLKSCLYVKGNLLLKRFQHWKWIIFKNLGLLLVYHLW